MSCDNLLYIRDDEGSSIGDSQENLLRPTTSCWLWRCCPFGCCCQTPLDTSPRVAQKPVFIHIAQASKKAGLQDKKVSYKWYRSSMACGLGGYASGSST